MNAQETTEPTKLFISHASEDKRDFVDSLKVRLREIGFDTWYDRDQLTLGDSLLHKIGEGLNECDFGVVVLSKNFFAKKWPRAELDGLFALETKERKVILPIWKDVTEADVKAFSPILAGRLGSRSEHGVGAVVEDIERAVQAAQRAVEVNPLAHAIDRLKRLDREITTSEQIAHLHKSLEGKRIIKESAKLVIHEVRSAVADVAKESKRLSYDYEHSNELEFIFRGSFNLEFSLTYQDFENFGVIDAGSAVIFAALRKYVNADGFDARTGILNLEYTPAFSLTGECKWVPRGEALELEPNGVASTILSEVERLLREAHQRALKKKR